MPQFSEALLPLHAAINALSYESSYVFKKKDMSIIKSYIIIIIALTDV